MRRTTTILQFSMLFTSVAGTLQSECGNTIRHDRGRFGGWLQDLGILNAYTYTRYKTFCTPTPPEMEIWQNNQPCADGLLFVAPGAAAEDPIAVASVDIEGPAIFKTNGELVWTQSGWGRTTDLKVQQIGDRSYITFWHDNDSRHDGGGSYVMLDQSYQMVKELKPVGIITSRPLELKLTKTGTAIMVMHNITQASRQFGGLENGWINEAIIQEVSVESNELIFEWRASQHFDIEKSQANKTGRGSTPETAFDFFHATGIDVDHDGNYVISSRNMCNAAAVRRKDGGLLWVLGGAINSLDDLSAGQAVAMASSQGVQWHGNTTLMLLDGGYVPHWEGRSGRPSNARMIYVNATSNMAVLMRTYRTPVAVASRHSHGSVQLLRSGRVFVGWGDSNPSAAAYTEYSREGRPLCAARFQEQQSVASAKFRATPPPTTSSGSGDGGRIVSKYQWTGAPAGPPVIVVRAWERAVYVSWNGDTQTTSWLLQSNNTLRGDGSLGISSVVKKTGFETRIPIPRDVGEVMQLVAVEGSGRVLVHSELLWKQDESGGAWSTTQRAMLESDGAEEEEHLRVGTLDHGWRQFLSSEKHCRLGLALAGLGASICALVWCRWKGRQLWKTVLAEGGSWQVLKGEKGVV